MSDWGDEAETIRRGFSDNRRGSRNKKPDFEDDWGDSAAEAPRERKGGRFGSGRPLVGGGNNNRNHDGGSNRNHDGGANRNRNHDGGGRGPPRGAGGANRDRNEDWDETPAAHGRNSGRPLVVNRERNDEDWGDEPAPVISSGRRPGRPRDGGGHRDRRDDDWGDDVAPTNASSRGSARPREGASRDPNADDWGDTPAHAGRPRGRKNDGEGGEDGGHGEVTKAREFYIPPEPSTDEVEIFSSGISTGINFSKYDNIPVKVSGENVPPAIKTFAEADLRDLIQQNVKKSGYRVPTPIQKTAIPIIAAGRDLMACAQTGSGKTAAYLLPIVNKILASNAAITIGKPQALIVSPTRELSIQIFNEARKYLLGSYIKVTIIYGGTSSKYQLDNVSKGCHILICTPGRLIDFVNRGFVDFGLLRYVVLDEADRMLDMGFKDDINRIMNHPTMRVHKERQNLMFSATFPEEIQHLAAQYLNEYVFVAIGVVGGACADVQQTIFEVKKFQKRSKLMELLHEEADGTIVFVDTKRGADFLASLLSETDFPTTSIHGDRLQSQREMALSDFKSGRMKVLIATSVAARGLDIKNIRHVVNYDMPQSIDEYVHRIGRTGRVGNNGKATSFFDPESDGSIAKDLVKILEGAGQPVPEFLQKYNTGGEYFQGEFGGSDVRGGGYVTADAEPEEDWG